jgi:hypothetical protein
MTAEITEFLDDLEANLIRISESDNVKEEFMAYLESPEGKLMSAGLTEEVSETTRFKELCRQHARWIL